MKSYFCLFMFVWVYLQYISWLDRELTPEARPQPEKWREIKSPHIFLEWRAQQSPMGTCFICFLSSLTSASLTCRSSPFLSREVSEVFWRRDKSVKKKKNLLRESEVLEGKRARVGTAGVPPSLPPSLTHILEAEGILLQVQLICSSPGSLIKEWSWEARKPQTLRTTDRD